MKRRNPIGAEAMEAMSYGIRKMGHVVVDVIQSDGYRECDVAVMWGQTTKRNTQTDCRDEIVSAHGEKPFLRLERGFIRRGLYHSVGLNGLRGKADFKNSDGGDRLERMNVIPKPLRHQEGYVLLIGQVPWDTAVQHIEFEEWVERKRAEIRSGGESVMFRPHPMITRPRSDLKEDLARASRVVTFNSTAAVDALIEGVPATADDEGSVIYRDQPFHGPEDQIAFLRRLAYAQWTLREMTLGLPWKHLMEESR